jgi:hypothetical protein
VNINGFPKQRADQAYGGHKERDETSRSTLLAIPVAAFARR